MQIDLFDVEIVLPSLLVLLGWYLGLMFLQRRRARLALRRWNERAGAGMAGVAVTCDHGHWYSPLTGECPTCAPRSGKPKHVDLSVRGE